jgi:hypothetical protein
MAIDFAHKLFKKLVHDSFSRAENPSVGRQHVQSTGALVEAGKVDVDSHQRSGGCQALLVPAILASSNLQGQEAERYSATCVRSLCEQSQSTC